MLSEMGINVIENDEDEQLNEITPTNKKTTTERADRTDDPVRMYLREMGSVDLLSREGEIAIAKRIEAEKEAMIEGLCESPLTFQAIIIWRDELNEGQVLLRDIIDLEASYEGPDAKNKKIVIDKADDEKNGDIESLVINLGNEKDIKAIISKNPVSDIVVALDNMDHEHVMKLISTINGAPVSIKIVPDLYEVVSGLARTEQISGVPLIEVNFQESSWSSSGMKLSLIHI